MIGAGFDDDDELVDALPFADTTSGHGSWSYGWAQGYVRMVVPEGGVVDDAYPHASTSLDSAWRCTPAPGSTVRDLTVRQVKHRATVRRARFAAIDGRGADLRRWEA